LPTAAVAPGMRELDCDFCGAPAEGAYEIGPASADRSLPDRRRLVLCGDCRETLSHAIQPLLDRLAATEGEEGARSDDAADATDADDVTDADRSGGHSETARGGDEGSGVGEGDVSETSASEATVGETATPPSTNSVADDAESADDDPLASSGASADDDSTDSGSGGASEGEDDSSESASASSGGSHAEEPPEFRRVMRLLNNRTFPVDRAEFTELATGAYDLDEREVDRIVEYAVERGVLAEDGGQLVKE
jgi:hypothetical protein